MFGLGRVASGIQGSHLSLMGRGFLAVSWFLELVGRVNSSSVSVFQDHRLGKIHRCE